MIIYRNTNWNKLAVYIYVDVNYTLPVFDDVLCSIHHTGLLPFDCVIYLSGMLSQNWYKFSMLYVAALLYVCLYKQQDFQLASDGDRSSAN